MKKPVVGIDCDGVLVDNALMWDRYLSEGRCGTKHPVVYDPTDWNRYDKVCKKCFKDLLFTPELLYAVTPRPDAEPFLKILSKQFELWLITSRPESTAEATKNWLFWNGLYPYFTGTVFSTNKKEVCESMGAIAMLDDAPHTLETLVDSGVHPICWGFPYNAHLRGMTRVYNWSEATSAIIEVATGLVPA